jgi:hypothetical protein
LRLALWTPAPEVPWLRALRPYLEREVDLEVVAAATDRPVEAEVHLYHLAGAPGHGFVLRALRDRPGVVLLEEWNLHRLVHVETCGRGDRSGWRAAARRAAGDTGVFVAGLVERGVAGEMLPLLLPLTEPALDASSAVAAFTRDAHARVGALRPGLPLEHVALPLVAAGPPPARAAARRAGGAAPDRARVVVLWPPGALARERVAAAIAPLRTDPRTDVHDLPSPGAVREALIAGADVLVALEHPSTGRLDPAVGAALHAGVATLVTAGSTAALELPEGVVARVSPGDGEAAELRALVLRLAIDRRLRARMGALARAHAAVEGDPGRAAARLLALARAAGAPAPRAAGPAASNPRAAAALDETSWIARSAGLTGAPADVRARAAGLFASGSDGLPPGRLLG